MCDFCGKLSVEEHECVRCGRMFCLDEGYRKQSEIDERLWICYECDDKMWARDALERHPCYSFYAW